MNSHIIVTADNSRKIMRDEKLSSPEELYFRLGLFKNETEGGQIVITAASDINRFSLKAGDFSLGSNVLPKESIEIFAVKYIEVKKRSDGHTQTKLGWYPDAMLPIDVSEKYGENKIKAGENQSIFVNISTGKNCVAGIYIGKFELELDGKIIQIPAEIEVWDYALPDENHTKQLFMISYAQMMFGEGEKSYELYERYFQKCFNYRINGARLPHRHREGFEEGLESYIQSLKKYHADPRCSVINLPVPINQNCDDIAYEKTEIILDRIIYESIKDGTNYFSKMINYIWILDEPHLDSKRPGYVRKVLYNYERLKEKLFEKHNKIAKNADITAILKSFMQVPNLITAAVMSSILPDNPDDYSIRWCPAFSSYRQEEFVKMYETAEEQWWYGCNWPVPPDPTYHIDDEIISARLVSWMQYYFGITGNLYWRLNFCSVTKNGKRQAPDDVYALANPYEGTNGEGFLVYPGKPYGLDNFVSTIRLEAIRDGIEEFEAMYALGKLWDKHGGGRQLAVNALMPVFSRFFNKSLILNTKENITAAREVLAKLLIAADKYGFAVLERKQTNDNVTLKLYAGNNKIEIEGTKYTAAGDNCCLVTTQKENLVIIVGEGESKIVIDYPVKEIIHPAMHAVTDCCAATLERYGVKGYDVKRLLLPYYEGIKNPESKNYNVHCKNLADLIITVYHTGAVIAVTDAQRGGVRIDVYLPPDCSITDGFTKEQSFLDGGSHWYKYSTKKTENIILSNVKENFAVTLYTRFQI